MTAKDLIQEQREWFVANFDHTKNQELADHLGCSLWSVTRMARELGLWKNKEFLAAMRRIAGASQKAHMSAEAFAEMHRSIGESRKETLRKERVRVNWGFEQKTNLRVVKSPKGKARLRNGLRKRGYEIARASNEATVTNETRRSIKMEARAEKMGINFNFNQIAI